MATDGTRTSPETAEHLHKPWNTQRLYKVIAFILIGICLGFYISYLKIIWLPEFLETRTGSEQNCILSGTDFTLFWTASYLALHGEGALLYDFDRLEQREKELCGVKIGLAWPYPPIYLLMVLPLSLLPYNVSLLAWLMITLACYLVVLYRIFPRSFTIFWALGFPGIAINFLVGHNGFLSGALLGGGLLCLYSSPIVAGILLGALSFKPQLVMLVPLALAAGRQWKALGAMLATVACLILASGLVFGYDLWIGFLNNIPYALTFTDCPLYLKKMATIFAVARLACLGAKMAWILQAIVSVVVVLVVLWVWSTPSSLAIKASLLVTGTLLFTRHAFGYDYSILAIPLVWLWKEGEAAGWLFLEQPILLFVWLAPLVSIILPATLDLPLGVFLLPIVLVLFVLVLSKATWTYRIDAADAKS